ncbi:MAG TPA: hypothetical protein PKY50_00220 [Candidatus Competibacter sp.]|nr:hypothetical protein [Candidatus Competibacter sp.]
MRCPECRHTQKYREGTRCKQCSYQFVFRKSADGISDFALRQLIQRLSDNGQQAFTATQLALAICRSWRQKKGALIGCGVAVLVIACVIGFGLKTFAGLAIFLVFTTPIIVSWWRISRIPFGKARKLVDRYHQAHPITALADGRAFRQQTASADNLEDPQYAPERILVVECDDLVDMLIRNRFHLSYKTAVVSRSGYPEQVFAACREFLRNHPNTPVQVLHDASTSGFNLTAQLAADPKWAFARERLTDLGISRAALDGDSSLPWLPPDNSWRGGAFGSNPAKMLRAGYRVPVDHIEPKPLLNLLGAAVVGGALLLTPEMSNTVETEIEIDYG